MKKLIIFTQDEIEKLYNDEPVKSVVDGVEHIYMSDYRYKQSCIKEYLEDDIW